MPIKIVIRTNSSTSHFRRLLLRLMDPVVGDSALICSGYIWEPYKGYSILNDELQQAIVRGCPAGITIVAGKLGASHYSKYYFNFVNKLSSVMSTRSYRATLDNWHAKVVIRLSQGKPVAGIIGSSNLTAPAYAENRMPNKFGPGWNYEADVVIWEESQKLNDHFGEASLNVDFGVIDAVLSQRVAQPSEEEQLKRIYNEIISQMEIPEI